MNELIVDLVALSGGRLVGRTRMQKTVFLLDAKGLNSGAAYYYHNFGPFSDEVVEAISDAKFTGDLSERKDVASDGSPFSIFETPKPAYEVHHLGGLGVAAAASLISRMSAVSTTVLELAATIHWLRVFEKVENWRPELVRRKGSKTAGGRTEKAEALLAELELA